MWFEVLVLFNDIMLPLQTHEDLTIRVPQQNPYQGVEHGGYSIFLRSCPGFQGTVNSIKMHIILAVFAHHKPTLLKKAQLHRHIMRKTKKLQGKNHTRSSLNRAVCWVLFPVSITERGVRVRPDHIDNLGPPPHTTMSPCTSTQARNFPSGGRAILSCLEGDIQCWHSVVWLRVSA